MHLVIVGTGYVGLVTGACFADLGNKVICLDIDEKKIECLNSGSLPFFEPGLEEMVARNREKGTLSFSTSYPDSLKDAAVAFLTVDTPVTENGEANLSYIKNAARSIAEYMKPGAVIVNKSTVPLGTAQKVREWVTEALDECGRSGLPFDVISNPEFLKEGGAIRDFMYPARVILGGDCPKSLNKVALLYDPIITKERLLLMDTASAELAKYAANAMLATRISFMNEIANIAEKAGANIESIRHAMSLDHRIGKEFLAPGPGFGGSCLPKDLRALIMQGKILGAATSLASAVCEVNSCQKMHMGEKILSYFEGEPKTIAILGLSFKPETDDLRESSSLTLIEQLIKNGYTLRLFDPVAMEKAKGLLKPFLECLTFCQDPYEAAEGSDAVCLMTEWKQFCGLDLEKLSALLETPVFFDARNQYTREEMDLKGFDYISLGRPPVMKATTVYV